MKIDVKPISEAGAAYIISNICKSHEAELDNLGKTKTEALDYVLTQIRLHPAEMAYFDGRPAAMFGMECDGQHAFTWFMCTEEFFDLGVRGVIFARRYLTRTRKQYPKYKFISISASPHKKAQRWIELLGGELVEVQGAFKTYVYS